MDDWKLETKPMVKLESPDERFVYCQVCLKSEIQERVLGRPER